VGAIGIGICAWASYDPKLGELHVLRVCGFGILIGGSSAVAGFVVGFLFGVPKTPDHPPQGVIPAREKAPAESSSDVVHEPDPTGAVAAPSVAPALKNAQPEKQLSAVNTNLEQISDWLTKIIVGVSLVEFNRIINKVIGLAGFLAIGIDWTPGGVQYATAIIAYFAPIGFFYGWIITRTFLTDLIDERALGRDG
jgi:hypothetical protein